MPASAGGLTKLDIASVRIWLVGGIDQIEEIDCGRCASHRWKEQLSVTRDPARGGSEESIKLMAAANRAAGGSICCYS